MKDTDLNRLKIGLLVDAPKASYFVHDLAKWGQRQESVSITHCIIVQHPPLAERRSKLKKLFAALYEGRFIQLLADFTWAQLTRFEKNAIAKSEYRHLLERTSLNKVVGKKIELVPNVSSGGKVFHFSDADVTRIKELGLDVLLRCGSGILKGEILKAAYYGVWSFHHGDNKVNRGMPAGFWEVRYKQNVTGFIIQQLTEELDGGRVISRGWFPTQGYYLLNNLLIQSRSNHYLKQALSKLATERTMPPVSPSQPYCDGLYKRPGLVDQFKYMNGRLTRKLMSLFCQHVLRKKDRWHVAFQKCDWRSLVMWKANVIKNPPGRFLADPFVIEKDGKDYCFVEDFDFDKNLGEISVYELKGNNAQRIGIVLSEPFHLSFPYVFEYSGKIYMIPETSQKKEVRLYEAVEFPLKWKMRKVLMSGISAADTVLLQRDETWWLLTNVALTEPGEHSSELMVFSADSPLSDQWEPLESNPVRVDGRNARNGGIVFDGDSLYRVAQRRGFLRYGKAIEIRKIIKIDNTGYEETFRYALEPRFSHRIIGGHHLHSNGRYTVFDYLVKERV